MAGFNTTQASAQNNSRIDKAQQNIVKAQNSMLRSIASGEGDQDAIRQRMFVLNSIIAAVRQFSQWIIDQQKASTEASKNTIQLASLGAG